MKTIFSILATLLISNMLSAQIYMREVDPKTKKTLLRGELTFKNLLDESNCHWLAKGESEYQPKHTTLEALNGLSKEYHFVVFLGTWCEDTHDLLPKFYKVVNEALIDLNSIQMFGVDRRKESLNNEQAVFKIDRIPTFIVFRQNREVGRITESVNKSIEEDLLEMMQKDTADLDAKQAIIREEYMQDTRKYEH